MGEPRPPSFQQQPYIVFVLRQEKAFMETEYSQDSTQTRGDPPVHGIRALGESQRPGRGALGCKAMSEITLSAPHGCTEHGQLGLSILGAVSQFAQQVSRGLEHAWYFLDA